MNLPVIRMEIEHMKHTLLTALSEHQFKMDEYVKDALNNYCSEENLRSVVMQSATKAIDAAVKEEVQAFFRYSGAGRKAIREAVIARLDRLDKAEWK